MKLTQIERREIVAEIQTKKVTMTELAERYRVSIVAISDVFKKMTGNTLKPQLSQSERKAIVAELQSGKTTEAELSVKYGIHYVTIGRVYKKETGKPLTIYKGMLKSAIDASQYRAWHKEEKTMYAVLGLDWLNQKVLIAASGAVAWYEMAFFIIMEYSGLRDRKRTLEHPEGQAIYVNDIVQFPILLQGNDGKVKDTVVTDSVVLEPESSGFILSKLDDPLAMYNDECEIIGNVYEKPELKSKAA